ncbi:BON domain-containing protein [Elizabethkingia sp. JS20170427COW]|uniref:BON domain-containing protein n=1 Tax=Elizabethkingia sp. JS20170427COW TaxID=2583851 RepID=UPI0011102BDF|nr:BON domain-containing protein [Elizabethkingia sp. JS20170427COW]QCX52836.1 BON domain-containing protein [Elizabethkingia sp. JS20170427COW]
MKKYVMTATLALGIALVAVSCSQKPNDSELTVQATKLVTSNPKAHVEVKDGVAHLSGEYATPEEKGKVINSIKALPGIKEVMDMTSLTPAPVEEVEVTPEDNLDKVKKALKDYPKIKVSLEKGKVVLTGEVTMKDAKNIKRIVDALNIGEYYNDLIID